MTYNGTRFIREELEYINQHVRGRRAGGPGGRRTLYTHLFHSVQAHLSLVAHTI